MGALENWFDHNFRRSNWCHTMLNCSIQPDGLTREMRIGVCARRTGIGENRI
jgi:hypothetical protein